ncbi:MAG: type II methionyl aminopeptidase [Candidatus Thermoplasmatota archaeon]|nr:type II methionyl aminopeptidase [Candidatus Thermoplasmatota archaeon]
MGNANIAEYRRAGKVAGAARDFGLSIVKEGGKLVDLAQDVESFIVKMGAKPAFPVNLSLNSVAAHYTPSKYDETVFKRGDVVKLDVGSHVDGFIADTAATMEIGTMRHQEMIVAAQSALEAAISLMRPGVDMYVVGAAIEGQIKSRGFLPIRNLTGHGLERYQLHTGFSVSNVPLKGESKPFSGQAVAIEPFATNGAGKVMDGDSGGIYSLIRAKPQKDADSEALLTHIINEFHTLPFADRWCEGKFSEKELNSALKTLVRTGCIRPYRILVEAGEGIVAQAEHTVIVQDDGCEVIT